MSSVKIGVVGGGRWGINHIRTLSKMGDLACIVEANPARAAELEREFSQTPICKSVEDCANFKVDGFVVATPVATHFAVAKALLDKKYHVLVEKPTTSTLAETEELLRLAEAQQRTLMTGFLLLYQPAILKIKELLDLNVLGEVRALHFARLNFGRARSFENAFWSLGVHDVAVLSFLQNSPLSAVTCVRQNQSPQTRDVDDDVRVQVDYQNGCRATVHSSWNWPLKRRELLVTGTQGFLFFDENLNQLQWHKKTFSEGLDNVDAGTEIFDFSSVEPLKLELEDFIDAIQGQSRPRAGAEITLKVAQILEKL